MATTDFPSNPDREIVSSRTIDFPITLVFEAWENPDHLKNWWGPNGFTNTFELFDFREGGRWKFIMHGPDKGNYQNEVEYLKIDKPNLIAWKRHSKPLFNIIASFEEIEKGKTKIVFRMVFETPEESNKLRPFVIDKNEENFDRLETELAKMTNQQK